MSRAKKICFSLGALALAILLALIGAELLTRWLWKDRPSLVGDERSLSYQYDSALGWFPVPNSSITFKDERLIHIQHNADGFRDALHGRKTKPRIAFVGDSFVWGYDVEQPERFTEKLQARIADWEILNLGVSGYGTDQEYLLLQRWFDRYQPDIVVLVFSDNDVEENSVNIAHRGYYKPYFELSDQGLQPRGIPVPRSLRYYCTAHPLYFKSQFLQWLVAGQISRRFPKVTSAKNPTLALVQALAGYTQSKGARFAVGFVTEIEGTKKRAFCEAAKLDYLFLLDSDHLNWDYMYRTGGHHWTPQGHEWVCAKFQQFLVDNHLLQATASPAADLPK